jgi:hypothetical protein
MVSPKDQGFTVWQKLVERSLFGLLIKVHVFYWLVVFKRNRFRSKSITFWPGCTKCIRLILVRWWMTGGRVTRASFNNIGYLLCVINFSYTFRLIFFKPCTVVMDTLKMCMWLFGSDRTFFEKLTCSWIKWFFQHVLHGQLTYFV